MPGLNQGKTANRHCSNACRPCASGDTANQYLPEAPPPPKFPPPPELSAAPGWLPESPPEAVAEAAALSRPSAATPAAVAATVTARSTPSSSDERCWAIPKKTGSRKSFSRAMIRPPNTPVSAAGQHCNSILIFCFCHKISMNIPETRLRELCNCLYGNRPCEFRIHTPCG